MSVRPTREHESVSNAVVIAVADKEGVAVDALDPLHDIVDTDALDTLFRGGEGTATSPYEGYRVTVDADGIGVTSRSGLALE